jgi:hypothetical protein
VVERGELAAGREELRGQITTPRPIPVNVAESVSRDGEVRCPVGGYGLGDAQDPCPECGTTVAHYEALRARRHRARLFLHLWFGLAAVVIVPAGLPYLRLPLSIDAALLIKLGFLGLAGTLGATIAVLSGPQSDLVRLFCAIVGFVTTTVVVVVLRVVATHALPYP